MVTPAEAQSRHGNTAWVIASSMRSASRTLSSKGSVVGALMNLEPEIGSVEEKHESAVQRNRKTISRGKSQLNRGNENGYNGFLSNGAGGGGGGRGRLSYRRDYKSAWPFGKAV